MPITVHHLQIHDTYRPHHNLDYKTIYPYPILSCKKCGLQYVGQTGNTFNERFRAYLTDITQGNTFKLVSRHFTSDNHSTDDVIATIITQTSNNVNIRLRTEVFINIFNSRHPAGLNLIQYSPGADFCTGLSF